MKKPETYVVTDAVRLHYARVWEPDAYDGRDPRYSCRVLIPKSDKATVTKIRAAIEAALNEGGERYPDRFPEWDGITFPLHDGDMEQTGEAYRDCWYLNARSKRAPAIVDRAVKPIKDRSQVYSGCYARVSLSFYPYVGESGGGVAVALGNIQKLRDGDPLESRAEDDFSAMNDFRTEEGEV